MSKQSKKTTRRGYGEGGIRERSNGKFEGAVTIYKKNGRRINKSFTRDTKNEVLDIMAKVRNLGVLDNNIKDIDINRHTNEIKLIRNGQSKASIGIGKDVTFGEYANYYLKTYRNKGLRGKQVEQTTFSCYADRIILLKKFIGDRKIAELTFEDLEDCINELHKNTCDTTARQCRDMIVSIMKYALKDGITEENVLQNEKITLKESKGKKEKKVIKEKDLGTFINYCMEHKCYELLLILNTGMRASELAGLTWDNLDTEKGTITIKKEYIRTYEYDEKLKKKVGEKKFKDLKTKASYRTIGLNDTMLNILKEHKEAQKQLAQYNNKTFKETDWIFTTKTYEGYVSDYTSDKFKKIVRTLKIEDYEELTTHSLRHTFCTLGIANDVRVEQMKEVLGHSNIAVTSNWYTHLDKEKVVEASNKVNTQLEKLMK